MIAQRIAEICQEIPPRVRLIAVTKQVSVDLMREAYVAGIRDFAESRLQEALPKIEELQDLTDISWHFIGHLQTNKVRKVIEYFQWIHSVDSLKLANSLNEISMNLSKSPQVFLQVKMLPDPNKYGWTISELLNDLPQLTECQYLKIRGLMTIMPLGLNNQEILAAFKKTQELAKSISQNSPLALTELSMGMSDDYLLAIQAGTTMIRLGRIIFGARNPRVINELPRPTGGRGF